jgi:hypothetical protein
MIDLRVWSLTLSSIGTFYLQGRAKRLYFLRNTIRMLNAVPMSACVQYFQFLLRRADMLKDIFATIQGRRLVFVASKNAHWYLNSRKVGFLGVDNCLAM